MNIAWQTNNVQKMIAAGNSIDGPLYEAKLQTAEGQLNRLKYDLAKAEALIAKYPKLAK